MIADHLVLERTGGVRYLDSGTSIYLDHPQLGILELNPVGAEVWEALQTPTTFGALVVIMAVEFDAPVDQVRRDIEPFIEALTRRGLVVAHV